MVDPIPVRNAEFDPQDRAKRQPHEHRSSRSRHPRDPQAKQLAASEERPTPHHQTGDSAIGSQLDMEV